GASEIDRQFQLETAGRRIIEIDQRKLGKLDPIDNLQTKGAPIKIERSRLVNDADHRVDELGHKLNSQLAWTSVMRPPRVKTVISCRTCDRLHHPGRE